MPITEKASIKQSSKTAAMSKVRAWLPEGEWFDFFTGEPIEGGKEHIMAYSLADYPVFAKAGAIIPMLPERKGNSQDFDELEVRVFAGENKYTLFDKQGSIDFDLKQSENGYTLTVTPSEDCVTKTVTIIPNAGFKVDGNEKISLDGTSKTVQIVKA